MPDVLAGWDECLDALADALESGRVEIIHHVAPSRPWWRRLCWWRKEQSDA